MLAAHLKLDLPIALRRLENVAAALPTNPDLAPARALIYGASGEAEKRKQAVEDALRFSKTADVTEWAKKRIGQ